MSRFFTGFVATIFVLANSQEVRSQDYYNFVQFYVNPSLINPSFTGIDGQPAAFLSYKKQWMGIKGAPTVGHLSIQVPLPSKVSVGFNVGTDKRGVLGTSSLGLALSYSAPMANDMFLRFGFSVGTAWTKVDVDALSFGTNSDAIVADLLSSNFQLLGNLGLSFHSKTFQIGAAIPNIFQPAYLSKDAFTISKIKPFESIILNSSYRFYFALDQYSFEPYVIYRLNTTKPSQLEAAGIVHLKGVAWAGASYKQNFGISGMIGFKPNKLFGLGYSYTLKNTGANQMSKPSHEIQLAMLFGSRDKKIPAYSFVNSEKEKRRMTTQERLHAVASTRPNQTPVKGGNKPTTSTTKPTTPVNVSRPRNSGSTPVLGTQINNQTSTNPVTNNQPTNPVVNNQATNPVTNNQTATNPTRNNQTTTTPTTNPVTNNQTATNPTRNNQTTNPVTNNQTTNPVTSNQATTNPVTNNQAANPVTNNQATNPVTNNQTATNPVTNNPTTNPVTSNQTATNPVTINQPVTNNQAATNPTTNDQASNPVTNNQPATTPTKEPEKIDHTLILETPAKFESADDSIQHHEELDKLSRLTEHSDNPTEEHNEEGTLHADRHEFHRRGDHAKELEVGGYVIVGAFRSEPNAKHFSDELKKLGFTEVSYGYLTAKSVWYIYITGFEDAEEGKTKRNKYRKMKMFKDAWLLTVTS